MAGGLASAPAAASAAVLAPGRQAPGRQAPGRQAPGSPQLPGTRAGSIVPPHVRARGADLADVTSGRQMWRRNLNVRRPIGSITKVMTALVVLRAGDLSRRIRVTRAAVRYVRRAGASTAGLIAGDVLTARQLLSAMLIPSGCDAAYLLATAYGPGWHAFVRKMNATARQMGLTATHFSHFDGMPFPTEYSTYSTPADLIQLGEQAMRHPIFRRIVARRRFYLARTARHHSYAWHSTDALLGSYRGAIGIKTGTTKAAGDCLLFEARRGRSTLIGVVLHATPTDRFGSRFTAARHMLTWGFRRLKAGSAASVPARLPVTARS